MLTLALVLFALAAVAGITLLTMHFRGTPLPMPLALVHGSLAAAGLVVLILAVSGGKTAGMSPGLALAGFVLAALGGFGLFSFQLRGIRHPSALVVIHGLIAVASFAILTSALLQ